MPAATVRRNRLWRVIDTSTGNLARDRRGRVVDGGGYDSRAEAARRARETNQRDAARKRNGHPVATGKRG